MTTDFDPKRTAIPTAPPPKKKGMAGPTIAIIVLGATSAFLLLLTLALAAAVGAKTITVSQRVPGPTKTITVVQVQHVPGPTKTKLVSTGVSQGDFNACKTAYGQVVSLLSQQTDILQGVANAASDGFQAVSNGDVSSLNAAAGRVDTLTTQEEGLSGQVNNVDATACQ